MTNRRDEQMTDRDKIKAAFRGLRREDGYVARVNFMCCSSCGWAEIGLSKKGADRCVFWNRQANDAFDGNGDLVDSLFLQWAGDGRLIARRLREQLGAGRVKTPKSEMKAIEITPQQAA